LAVEEGVDCPRIVVGSDMELDVLEAEVDESISLEPHVVENGVESDEEEMASDVETGEPHHEEMASDVCDCPCSLSHRDRHHEQEKHVASKRQVDDEVMEKRLG
jgi:hypothetical protein